jgi:anti-sigma B factor antagonist
MNLDLREKNGISILVLGGQLTGGGGDEQLREAIDTLLAAGRTQILLDFSDITFMDSAGMGELVSGHRTVERFGGALKILNPNKRVHNSLTMAKLLPIFEIFDDEDNALGSYVKADT